MSQTLGREPCVYYSLKPNNNPVRSVIIAILWMRKLRLEESRHFFGISCVLPVFPKVGKKILPTLQGRS